MLAAVVVLESVLSTGPAGAQTTMGGSEVKGGDGLVMQVGRFEQTWVHPDADFSRYGRLDLRGTVFRFRKEEPTRGGLVLGSFLRTFDVGSDAGSRERFEKVVGGAFAAELGRGRLLS